MKKRSKLMIICFSYKALPRYEVFFRYDTAGYWLILQKVVRVKCHMATNLFNFFFVALYWRFLFNFLQLFGGFHLIIRITPKYFTVNWCVVTCNKLYFMPKFIVSRVFKKLWRQLEMLIPEFGSERLYFFRNESFLSCPFSFNKISAISNNSNLWIPVSQKASIINIGRSNNRTVIINNHQFWVDVNNLRHWLTFNVYTMSSKTKKLNVIIWVYSKLGNSLNEILYCFVVPVHYHS